MSLGPFDTTPVEDRVRAEVSGLRLVGGAADRAAAMRNATTLPAAFVILAGERIVSTPASGVQVHSVTAQIDVLVGVRHARAKERGAAHADLGRPIVEEIRGALNNWKPPGPDGALTEAMAGNGQSGLLALTDAEWWWVDRYTVHYTGRA